MKTTTTRTPEQIQATKDQAQKDREKREAREKQKEAEKEARDKQKAADKAAQKQERERLKAERAEKWKALTPEQRKAALEMERAEARALREKAFPPLSWQQAFWAIAEFIHPHLTFDEEARREIWPTTVMMWRAHRLRPLVAAHAICIKCAVPSDPARPAPIPVNRVLWAGEQPKTKLPRGLGKEQSTEAVDERALPGWQPIPAPKPAKPAKEPKAPATPKPPRAPKEPKAAKKTKAAKAEAPATPKPAKEKKTVKTTPPPPPPPPARTPAAASPPPPPPPSAKAPAKKKAAAPAPAATPAPLSPEKLAALMAVAGPAMAKAIEDAKNKRKQS